MTVLHIDADTFFLAVHERTDPSLRGKPVVLWQYNDVICASARARQLGVKKHMHPKEAKQLVEPEGGMLVHAYWRSWPGPRIWYGPYNAASRELHDTIRCALREIAPTARLERASVDEAFVDVGVHVSQLQHQHNDAYAIAGDYAAPEDAAAVLVAERLFTALMSSGLELPVTIGIGPNKLIAKLASSARKAARGIATAGGVCAALTHQQIELLLRKSKPSRIPGLGTRAKELENHAIANIAALQAFPVNQLQQMFGLTFEAARLLHTRCRGIDDGQVEETAPSSVSVTSWLANDLFVNLAKRTHEAATMDSHTVVVAGWRFQPHTLKSKSNATRARWIVLSLALDLEEKLCHHVLVYRQLPTKLTCSWQAGGLTAMGSGAAGPASSRMVSLQCDVFSDVKEESFRCSVEFLKSGQSGQAGDDIISPETLVVESASERARVQDESTAYGRRVAAIVDAACGVFATWSGELSKDQRVTQITLNAHGFINIPNSAGTIKAYFPITTSPGPPQDQATASVSVTQPSPSQPRETSWACAMCTFLNSELLSRCEMCDAPHQDPPCVTMHAEKKRKRTAAQPSISNFFMKKP